MKTADGTLKPHKRIFQNKREALEWMTEGVILLIHLVHCTFDARQNHLPHQKLRLNHMIEAGRERCLPK